MQVPVQLSASPASQPVSQPVQLATSHNPDQLISRLTFVAPPASSFHSYWRARSQTRLSLLLIVARRTSHTSHTSDNALCSQPANLRFRFRFRLVSCVSVVRRVFWSSACNVFYFVFVFLVGVKFHITLVNLIRRSSHTAKKVIKTTLHTPANRRSASKWWHITQLHLTPWDRLSGCGPGNLNILFINICTAFNCALRPHVVEQLKPKKQMKKTIWKKKTKTKFTEKKKPLKNANNLKHFGRH